MRSDAEELRLIRIGHLRVDEPGRVDVVLEERSGLDLPLGYIATTRTTTPVLSITRLT